MMSVEVPKRMPITPAVTPVMRHEADQQAQTGRKL